jgi:hypothetical protein
MDKLHCNRTIIVIALLVLIGMATSCHESKSSEAAKTAVSQEPLTLRNLDKPGSFEIQNNGPAISLYSQVIVQRLEEGNWQDAALDLVISETCELNPKPGCTTLASHATIHPAPWNGMSCSGQCPLGCRGNIFLGPGKFRFVVTSCYRKQKFYSPAFTLSANDPMEPKKK